MKLRTATHLALALLAAAGMGVSAGSAAGQSAKTTRKRASASSKAPGNTASTTAQSKTPSKRSGKKSGKRSTSGSSRNKGQKAPTPERITQIQEALAKDGSYAGAPNGKWDDGTVAAMKKYQEAHGLNPSGKLDAKTLNQLGLGSQTAGVAAPMPPVASSSTVSPTKPIARRQ
jgi:peptidoglycan hydrolase-like protein with peptidoglycan-binding domain